jgi:hypothetical protein
MINPWWIVLAVALAPAAQDREIVTQTTCMSLEGKAVEAAKQELLLAARRDAMEKLLGSVVTSITRVEDLALRKDKIQAASAGFLRLQGEPEYFNGQALGELCVRVKAYTLDEDRAAIEMAMRALVEGQAQPRFVLDTDLNHLGLGSHAVVAVAAIPAQALDGARCDWTVEPPDVLRATGADGACRLEVAMPAAPLPGRASTLPARIAVRIRRGDQVLDELTVRGAVHNGIPIEPVAGAAALTPGGTAVPVKIVPRGRQDPVPPGFTCSWSMGTAPLVFRPATENGCQGSLELKPEDTWSQIEGMAYASALLGQEPLSVAVRLLHDSGLVNEGTAEVKLTLADSRDPQRLLWRFVQYHPRGGIGGLDDMLSEVGLPPSSSFNEKNLEIHLAFESDEWTVTAYYNSGEPEAPPVSLDRGTSLLRILYSLDGKEFVRWGNERPAEDLAGATHIWVKVEPGLGGEAAGPFRLPFNFPTAARAALAAAWKTMRKDEKQRFVCGGLVDGRERYLGAFHHEFLAILDDVSVGRGEGALWRTRHYGGNAEHLVEKSFEPLLPPVGPADYTVRLRFVGGAEEVFACSSGALPGTAKAGLHYYRLKRTAAKAASMPEEIEVYLEYRDVMGWTVTYGDGLKPAFVRVSSGGGGFRTVEQNATDHNMVTFGEAQGKELILRFVMDGGEEVEYRGAVDYAAHRFATLRDALFSASKLACAAYDPPKADEDDVDRRPRGMEGPAVVCGFAAGGRDYLPVASTLLILRSVAYGCAKDRLTIEDRFDDERTLGTQGKWEELTFALPGHCDTVFARFTLADGSQSEILAAPVLSPR